LTDDEAFSSSKWSVRARILILKSKKFVVVTLTSIALTGCAGGSGHREFAGSPQVIAGGCPELANQGHGIRSILKVQKSSVVFMPAEGVVELNGHVDAAGRVTASRSSIGADHHVFEMVFEGKLAGDAVDGIFATPRCRASIKMGAI